MYSFLILWVFPLIILLNCPWVIPSTGATFNDSVYLYHNNTGAGVWSLNTVTGNRFNGKVAIKNISTKEITFGGAGINVFNGDIVMENTGSGGIIFGDDTLTAGHTMSIGSSGYSAGTFEATNFYQAGNAAISLTFTGTALPSLNGATFGGNFSVTANTLLFKFCNFNGTAAFTATGSGSSSWYGGNKFYGDLTLTNNASAGNMRPDADTSNTYFANAMFNGSRELRICYGSATSSFYGNITTGSNTTFNAGTGTLCLAGSGNQTLSFSGSYPVKNLMLNKSSGNATLSTALVVSGTITFVKGTLTTTSSYLLTINNGGSVSGASDSSFIDGPVKKIGNSAFVFPTGKGNSYRAIGISAPSNTTDGFTGEYFNIGQTLGNDMDTTINIISGCNYWNLTRNTGNSNLDVSFQFDSTSCDWNLPDSSHLAFWNGSKWNDKGISIPSYGKIYSATSLNSFGNFLIAYNIKQPLKSFLDYALISFDTLNLDSNLTANGLIGAKYFNDTTLLVNNNFISDTIELNRLKAEMVNFTDSLFMISDSVINTNQILGKTVTAGTYYINSAIKWDDFTILVGDSTSKFIFKVKGNLNFEGNAAINLSGVRPENIIFLVGGDLMIKDTIFANGIFIVMKNTSIYGLMNGQKSIYCFNNINIYRPLNLSSPASVLSTWQSFFNFSACNLDFVQATKDLHQRPYSPVGFGNSQSNGLFNISYSGTIIQANVFFTLVSVNNPPTTINFSFNGNSITALRFAGENGSTCWESSGYAFTASYVAYIPNNQVVSGGNTISGLPVHPSGIDVDGASLFVIYRKTCSNTSLSFLSADYGLQLNSTVTISRQLSVFTNCPCFNPNASKIFMLLGDYEIYTNNTSLRVSSQYNSINVPVQGQMFNYASIVNSTLIQQSFLKLISMKNGTDCGNASLFGVLYSCTNNTICPSTPTIDAGADVVLGTSCHFPNSASIGSLSNNISWTYQWTCNQVWGIQGVGNPNKRFTILQYPLNTPPTGASAQFTLTATTSGGCSGSDVMNANFVTCRMAGEETSHVINQEFKMYPNPATKILNFDLISSDNDNYLIIEDNLGRNVLYFNVETLKRNLSIDISKLKSGIYYVKYFGGNELIVKKLFIEHD
jgi:hypothetical protein